MGLREHLERHHSSPWRETDGQGLAVVHRFEHLEQDMGLIELDHRHAGTESQTS